jgi:hypothetical protein
MKNSIRRHIGKVKLLKCHFGQQKKQLKKGHPKMIVWQTLKKVKIKNYFLKKK